MLKLLFICDAGLRRSPTAAALFADRAETRFRGVRAGLIARLNFAPPELLEWAKTFQLTAEDFRWADRIFCMDKRNEVYIRQKFGLKSYDYKIVVLCVPDRFAKGDPRLVAAFEAMAEYIVGDKDPDNMPPIFR